MLAYTGAAAALVWAISLWQNLGVGVDSTGTPGGWGTSKAMFEVSMVRGGVVLIVGGTRTDSITYDPITGFTTSELFGGRVYVLDVHTVAGPLVWWPRFERPAAWSGPYIFLPLWPLALGCGATSAWLWGKSRRIVPGVCPTCGYALAGLPAGAACPECGGVMPKE